MKKLFLFFLFSANLFSTEYLKGILLDKEKNFIKEFEKIKGFDTSFFDINEGFILYYPDGMPPLCYKFRNKEFEKVFEAENLKEISYKPRDCEYMEEIKGIFKFTPEKPFKDFPFDKKYNFILYEKGEFLYLREGKYFIEELGGLYFSPNPLNPEEFIGSILYPSFKTKILITDGRGQILENCKAIINYESQPFGKLCEKTKSQYTKEGNEYYLLFPLEANVNFKVFCSSSPTLTLNVNSREITDPFIINLKRLGSVEGYLIDENESPISSYNLSIFREGEFFPLKSTQTDKDGFFKFSDLEDGIYKIKDCVPQEIPQGKNFTLRVRDSLAFNGAFGDLKVFVRDEPEGVYVNELVDLKGGENRTLNLVLPVPKIWEGVVLNSNGDPIPGVLITSMGKILSSSNEKGEFKINFRGKVLKEVEFSAPGYSSFYFDEVLMEDAPSEVILKAKGSFKVTIYLEGKEIQKITKIMDCLKFLNSEGEVYGETSFNFGENSAVIRSKLPEGEYQFALEGWPFKPFISEVFFVESGKELDYGNVKVELESTEEKKTPKEVVIKFKDWMNHPAEGTNVIIMARSFENPNFTFSQTAVADREGKIVFKPIEENFLFVFIYADGEKGFLKMDMEEVADLSNLISFELKLNPPNELFIRISNIKTKEGKFRVVLKSKYNQIIEEIYPKEEKTFKNLFSPLEIEIFDGSSIIWKELLDLKPGKNEVLL